MTRLVASCTTRLVALAALLPDSMSTYLDPVSSADALAKGCYWTDWTTLRPFLMASIPRLSAGSPLRHLPNELLQARTPEA